jgi:predicted phage tail protein
MQGQRVITEVQKQAVSPDESTVQQQIAGIQNKLNQDKSKLLQQKNQFLQQLQTVQTLELDREVNQGQMESFFTVGVGDNLIQKMQVEVVLRDGVVEDIRGEL